MPTPSKLSGLKGDLRSSPRPDEALTGPPPTISAGDWRGEPPPPWARNVTLVRWPRVCAFSGDPEPPDGAKLRPGEEGVASDGEDGVVSERNIRSRFSRCTASFSLRSRTVSAAVAWKS